MSIKSWNYIPEEWIYNKLEDENSPLHLGIELEIDKGGESEETATFIEEKLGKNNCYIVHDGSLSRGNGLEIVTYPCSLKYHKQLPYKELFKELINKGYRSHNTSTCGFHVHIDRSYLGENATKIDLNLSKLLYLIEKFWNNVVVVARRDENRYNQRYRHRVNENESIFDILKDAKCLIHDYEGKYMCVNLRHKNSIELRMFKGTLKYESFIATLEFVSNLVNVAINTPLDYIEGVTFKTIINYGDTEYLKDYYSDRVNRTVKCDIEETGLEVEIDTSISSNPMGNQSELVQIGGCRAATNSQNIHTDLVDELSMQEVLRPFEVNASSRNEINIGSLEV